MKFRITPDGQRYFRMARGGREPIPFHLRWLLPFLCGDVTALWFVVNVMSMAAVIALTGILALEHGATYKQAALAALLMAGLPSIRFAWFAPILVDMPGLALSLGAALLWQIEPIAALAVVAIGAAISEKAPVWAAVFALEPILLVGLVVPLARRLAVTPGEVAPTDPLAWTLRPLHAGRRAHVNQWRNPHFMLLPWGACIVALLAPSPWLLLALGVGYAQLIVATDTVRLYQQAAPVACVVAAMVIPEQWAPLILAGHWLNPWMGNGL